MLLLSPLPLRRPSTQTPCLHWGSIKRMRASSFRGRKLGRLQDLTVCSLPAWEPALTSWPWSSNRFSADLWICVRFLPAPNTPPSSWFPKKDPITGLNNYRYVGLMSVVMNSFEILMLEYLKEITGPLAVCLPGKQVSGWCSQYGTALQNCRL